MGYHWLTAKKPSNWWKVIVNSHEGVAKNVSSSANAYSNMYYKWNYHF